LAEQNISEQPPKGKRPFFLGRDSDVAGILDEIVRTKHDEVEALKPRAAELRALAEAAPAARGFAAALRREREVRLLAEVKRRSPSAGEIRPGADAAEVALAYQAAGAAALSVLTDERYFGGSLDALRQVRRAVELPLLRKDFVVDALQLWEARGAGADAVLLIVRILDDAELRDLLSLAGELGMDALVEAHNAAEMDRALAAGATLLGVNNRDLQTFHTDLGLSLALAPTVGEGVTFVAESGIRGAEDVLRLGEAGAHAILVGESLMREPDVTAAAARLVGHARRPRNTPGVLA
jgi:indole-3-glycerol phosphate synthase